MKNFTQIFLFVVIIFGISTSDVYGISQCTDDIDNDNDSNTDLADPDCLGLWEIKQSIPTAVSGSAATVLDDKIYVAGGRSNDFPQNNLTTVNVYDPVTNIWNNIASLNQGRAAVPVLEAVNGRLYVTGGLYQIRQNGILEVLNSLEEYNPDTDSWVYKTPMPTPRYGNTSAVLNNEIYVIGGTNIDEFGNISTALPIMEVYNPVTDSWASKTPPTILIHNAGAAVVDGLLYLIGGQDIYEVSINNVQVYNPSSDSWFDVSSMPSTVISPGIAVIDGSIFVYGGHERTSAGATYSNNVYEYVPSSDSWFQHTSLPTARSQFGSTGLNGKAYSIGGSTYNGRTVFHDEVEVFTPSPSEGVKVAQSLEELVAELEETVEDDVDTKSVKNSYFAHIKKLLEFYDSSRFVAGVNQIRALLKKVTKDAEQGDLNEGVDTEIIDLSKKIEEIISEGKLDEVPLITQIASPYPQKSSSWADVSYANGSGAGSCGATIGACGCVLSSMSMISHYYGVSKGVDGKEINPLNLNKWLENNSGYTSDGSAYWGKLLEYFGTMTNEGVETNFSLDTHNETDGTVIDTFLELMQPVLAFNANLGHYFVLTDKNDDSSYDVRDPFWYNTETTGDTKDAVNHVQGYNNVISKANLFTYSETPHKIASMIELHLASPAELLLTDGEGNKVGYDSNTGMVVNEVPGASYDQSSVISSTGEVANPHVEKVLMVMLPTDSVYTVEVIGTGTGDYTLSVLTIGSNGESQVKEINSSTSFGEVDEFMIDVEVGDGELSLILEEIRIALETIDEPARSIIENKLRVIEDKIEKENIIATDSLIAGLLTQLAHGDELNVEEITALLEELVEVL